MADDGSHDSGSPRGGVREQDRFLPVADISSIMKKAVRPTARSPRRPCKASDKCQKAKRKGTICSRSWPRLASRSTWTPSRSTCTSTEM